MSGPFPYFSTSDTPATGQAETPPPIAGFTLTSDAHLVQGKKTLQASDLTNDVGRNVKVRYRMDGSTKVADRIEVATTTTPAAKPQG